MARKGSVSIHMLIFLILGLLLIWFVGFPLLQTLYEGWQSGFVCEGQCDITCGDGYRNDLNGDAYCRKHFEGAKAGGNKCCIPLEPGSQVIRTSDLKLSYTTKSNDPLPNGATVTLVPKRKDGVYAVSGTFALTFVGDAAQKNCYWRVGEEDWQENVNGGLAPGTLFNQLFRKYLVFRDETKSVTPPIKPCSALQGTSTLRVPFLDDGKPIHTDLFGKRMKYTLVVVDSDCTSDVEHCDSFEHTVYIQIPEWHPGISLSVDKKTVGTKDAFPLETGQTNKFALTINDPYARCLVSYDVTINVDGELSLPFEPAAKQGVILDDKKCFDSPYEYDFSLFIPEGNTKAIPFEITVNTSVGPRSLVITFPFIIAPEERVRVTGPSAGYAREKFVDISCHDVSCTSFAAAYIEDPFACSADGAAVIKKEDWEDLQDQLVVYGGANSAMWRFSIKEEEVNGKEVNGKYLCIKADTNIGDIYSLGLHQNLPSKITLDATPPELTAKYNAFEGKMMMTCTDTGKYKSGCTARPFSYAYVVDPFAFGRSVLALGTLNAGWSGCPDPYAGHYVTFNGEGGEMPYLEKDVRVMCIRASDNAGNHVVKSRLVYGSAEVLGAFLIAYAES